MQYLKWTNCILCLPPSIFVNSYIYIITTQTVKHSINSPRILPHLCCPKKHFLGELSLKQVLLFFFVVFLWHRNDWTCNHCISTAFLSATTATFRVYSFSQGVFTETEQNDQSLPLQRNNRLSSNTSINSEQQHSFQKPRTSLPTVSDNTSRNFPVSFSEFELDWWHGTVTQFQSSLTDGVICMRHATSEVLYLRPAF